MQPKRESDAIPDWLWMLQVTTTGVCMLTWSCTNAMYSCNVPTLGWLTWSSTKVIMDMHYQHDGNANQQPADGHNVQWPAKAPLHSAMGQMHACNNNLSSMQKTPCKHT
jgi:hypothetical protein